MRNLYEVLGVPRDADPETLKKVYKQLARELHPDRNPSPEAEARFKEVNAAYDILGDEKKRALYDEFGEQSLQAGFDAEKARYFRDAASNSNGPNFNFEDFFSGFYGSAGSPRYNMSRPGMDMQTRVELDLLTAVRGGEVQIRLHRTRSCPTCSGRGGSGLTLCRHCQGSGMKTFRQFGASSVVRCDDCQGTGQVLRDRCRTCEGEGQITGDEALRVRIPAGVEDGEVLRLRGQGEPGIEGGQPGDLIVEVKVSTDARFRRMGRDLELDVPITLGEAIAGGKLEVPTPTGTYKVTVPPGSNNGARLRLRGKGVTRRGDSPGDLYIVLRPTLPEAPSDALKELIKQLEAEYPRDVRSGLVF